MLMIAFYVCTGLSCKWQFTETKSCNLMQVQIAVVLWLKAHPQFDIAPDTQHPVQCGPDVRPGMYI